MRKCESEFSIRKEVSFFHVFFQICFRSFLNRSWVAIRVRKMEEGGEEYFKYEE